MDYSQATEDLIDRQCRNVERADFVLDKKVGAELVLQTYDLFNLPRPKKVVWCKSPFDEKFQGSARSAGSAGSAWSAWSAGSAWSAWSAGSAGSAGSAWSAWSARSAGSARSAWSAWSAGSAGSALDYDFDYYIFEHEYCQNPDVRNLPNENDKKYLEYCELLMQAKEAGVGYRIEWEDILYLAPTPLVRINAQNLFHSDQFPAIRWKEADEYCYLNGVFFPADLWKKVTSHQLPFGEILAIVDIDQRTQAMRYGNVEEFLKHVGAKVLDTYQKFLPSGEPIHYSLYEIPHSEQSPFQENAYYMRYSCPSTNKDYMSGVYKPMRIQDLTVPHMMAWKTQLSEEDWKQLVPLVTES